MKPLTIITVGGVLAITAASAPTQAQPAGAQAEVLFRRGQELLTAGKVAEACAAFDSSQKLDPTTSTQLNRAACREKNGQLATAWGLFLEAARQTRTATDAVSQQRHKVAGERAAKLEPRLSTLAITISADSQVGGLEILRDGEPVDAAGWNQALPIDGGTYTITARAPGNAEWSTKITINAERDARTVLIPKLQPAALTKAGADAPASRVIAPVSSESAMHINSKAVPLAVGGGAVVLVGAAVAFDLWGNSTYSDAKAALDRDKQISLWHSANTKRYLADGMGIAGVACGGVAVWLYLRSRGSDNDDAARAQTSRLFVDPVLGGGRAGLQLSGRF